MPVLSNLSRRRIKNDVDIDNTSLSSSILSRRRKTNDNDNTSSLKHPTKKKDEKSPKQHGLRAVMMNHQLKRHGRKKNAIQNYRNKNLSIDKENMQPLDCSSTISSNVTFVTAMSTAPLQDILMTPPRITKNDDTTVTPEGLRPRVSCSELKLLFKTQGMDSLDSTTASFHWSVAESPKIQQGKALTAVGALVAGLTPPEMNPNARLNDNLEVLSKESSSHESLLSMAWRDYQNQYEMLCEEEYSNEFTNESPNKEDQKILLQTELHEYDELSSNQKTTCYDFNPIIQFAALNCEDNSNDLSAITFLETKKDLTKSKEQTLLKIFLKKNCIQYSWHQKKQLSRFYAMLMAMNTIQLDSLEDDDFYQDKTMQAIRFFSSLVEQISTDFLLKQNIQTTFSVFTSPSSSTHTTPTISNVSQLEEQIVPLLQDFTELVDGYLQINAKIFQKLNDDHPYEEIQQELCSIYLDFMKLTVPELSDIEQHIQSSNLLNNSKQSSPLAPFSGTMDTKSPVEPITLPLFTPEKKQMTVLR